jgi:DNA topoisomerase-2
MVTFDEKGQLKKHDSVDSIIDDFCPLRYLYYIKRKASLIGKLEKELRHLGNKERFITEVINEELDIMNQPEKKILAELEKRGYDKVESTKIKSEDDEEEEEESDKEIAGGYNYLLRLQVRTFTADKVKAIRKDIASAEKMLDTVRITSEKDMWISELEELKLAYAKWEKAMNTKKSAVVKKGKKK